MIIIGWSSRFCLFCFSLLCVLACTMFPYGIRLCFSSACGVHHLGLWQLLAVGVRNTKSNDVTHNQRYLYANGEARGCGLRPQSLADGVLMCDTPAKQHCGVRLQGMTYAHEKTGIETVQSKSTPLSIIPKQVWLGLTHTLLQYGPITNCALHLKWCSRCSSSIKAVMESNQNDNNTHTHTQPQ